MSRFIPLKEWARQTYGDSAPCSNTLYAWVRDSKIYPAPEKHGRTFFVSPEAVYSPCGRPMPSLVQRAFGNGKASKHGAP